MNYHQVKLLFRERSGRYDLIGQAGEDKGGGQYLNDGQRLLDKLSTAKPGQRYFSVIAAGAFWAAIPNLRVAREVWYVADDGRVKLERKDLDWLRLNYYTPLSSSTTLSPPVRTTIPGDIPSGSSGVRYWSPVELGRAPSQAQLEHSRAFDFLHDMDALMNGREEGFGGIVIAGPPSTAGTLWVDGLFYSEELADNYGQTYWTVANPSLLCLAARYCLEREYRNTQGEADLMASIQRELALDDRDAADQSQVEATQLIG